MMRTYNDGEPLTAEGQLLSLAACALHCSVCDGVDHHWLPACDDDGEPLLVCAHCSAWREMTDDDDLS